jgi:hypothetical protein
MSRAACISRAWIGPFYGVVGESCRGTDMDWQDAAYLLVGFLLGVSAALWILIFIAQNGG